MNSEAARAIHQAASRAVEAARAAAVAFRNIRVGFARTIGQARHELVEADRKYRPSVSEQAMPPRLSGKPEPLNTKYSLIFVGSSRDGLRSVYKPSYLETLTDVYRVPDGYYVWSPVRYGIPSGAGELAKRDVAAFRVDEALKFGRVPPTAMIEGVYGPGSGQLWVFSRPSHPQLERLRHRKQMNRPLLRSEKIELKKLNAKYPTLQREQMAVLDYVIGNTDRNWSNYRTGPNGEIVAIDNSLTFPEFPDARCGIRSDFVEEFHHVDLSEEVMRNVHAVDQNHLRSALQDLRLSEKAIKGALDRLTEIQTHGKITGKAWEPGEIVDGNTWAAETKSLPSGWLET